MENIFESVQRNPVYPSLDSPSPSWPLFSPPISTTSIVHRSVAIRAWNRRLHTSSRDIKLVKHVRERRIIRDYPNGNIVAVTRVYKLVCLEGRIEPRSVTIIFQPCRVPTPAFSPDRKKSIKHEASKGLRLGVQRRGEGNENVDVILE